MLGGSRRMNKQKMNPMAFFQTQKLEEAGSYKNRNKYAFINFRLIGVRWIQVFALFDANNKTFSSFYVWYYVVRCNVAFLLFLAFFYLHSKCIHFQRLNIYFSEKWKIGFMKIDRSKHILRERPIIVVKKLFDGNIASIGGRIWIQCIPNSLKMINIHLFQFWTITVLWA